MMGRLLLALSALFLVAFCSEEYNRFCHNLKCPVYELIATREGFEERRYNETRWISTTIKSDKPEDATATYQRLKSFCDNNGETGHNVSNTWPALIDVTEGQYFMQWFIPVGNGITGDSSVSVVTRAEATVYVRIFDGTPSVASGQSNAARLREDLERAGISYSHREYMGAGYDSFFSLTHHNEIWIFAA
ncbi:unnamed protein product [Ophioblennius macclurei]